MQKARKANWNTHIVRKNEAVLSDFCWNISVQSHGPVQLVNLHVEAVICVIVVVGDKQEFHRGNGEGPLFVSFVGGLDPVQESLVDKATGPEKPPCQLDLESKAHNNVSTLCKTRSSQIA